MTRSRLSILLLFQLLQCTLGQIDIATKYMNKLPVCGQSCFKASLDKSQSFGCELNNLTCLCNNSNFGLDLEQGCKQSCINAADLSTTESGFFDACAAVRPKTEEISTTTSQSSKSTVTRTRFLTVTPVSFVVVTPPSPTQTVNGLNISPFASSVHSGSASVIFPAQSASPSGSFPPSFSPTANITALHPSMPTSSKIGMGLGIPIGVLIGIASFMIIVHRCRQHRRPQHDTTSHRLKQNPMSTPPPFDHFSASTTIRHEPRRLNPSTSAGTWVNGVWIADIAGLMESPNSRGDWDAATPEMGSPDTLLGKERKLQELEGEAPVFELRGTDHWDRRETMKEEVGRDC